MSSTYTYLPEGLPIPTWDPDGLQRPFWTGLREEQIRIQRCHSCQTWLWPPEWICYKCLSFEIDWVPVPGSGFIYSWSRSWHPVHPVLKEHGPYLTVLVELADAGGSRVVGNLLGDPLQEVAIGTPVQAVFEHHTEGIEPYTLLQWKVTD